MITYSQRDSRWANEHLGQSSLTMGRYGCTTTCISDLSTYFGNNFDPLYAVKYLKYTNDGLILWQSCKFSKFGFERREFGRNDAEIQKALKDPARAVILNVANGSHWVVCTGKTIFGQYKIADPWLGDFSTMSRYGNDISGAAYFKK